MSRGRLDTFTLDTNLAAVAASPPIDVSNLDNITVDVVQKVDDGTVTAQLERSNDGTVWVAVGATIAHTDFAAVVNAAVQRTLSDANGMPLRVRQVRLNVTAYTGTGEYNIVVAGVKRV